MENFRLFPSTGMAVDTAAGLECLLRGNTLLRLAGARGRRIRCTSGCAWITAPGMIEDVFLRDGEHWRVNTDGLVLIEAIGTAAVAIACGDQAMSPST